MNKNKTLSIVMPAYNEAAVIEGVIDALPREIIVGKSKYLVNIIVVNDGSKDETAEIVAKKKEIYLVNHLLNSGAGAATRTGLNFAKELKSDYVVIMDSDGQHMAEDAVKLAREIAKGGADLIIGSRLIDNQGMPWYRIMGNKGLSFITFLIFGVFVGDSQSGLRALNRKALSKVRFHSNHYAFCSEMLWSAKRQGLKIKEIPIKAVYSDYSLAKGQSNWGVIAIITQLLKQRFMDIING